MFTKWQSQAEVLSLVPQASVINNCNAFPISPPECGLLDKEQKKHRSQTGKECGVERERRRETEERF